LKGLVYSQI